jgi:Na+/H+-dicarboxylate symporter
MPILNWIRSFFAWPLYKQIVAGLIAGVAAGLAANLFELEGFKTVLVNLEPIGTAFIRLITMIVIPLVVASLRTIW